MADTHARGIYDSEDVAELRDALETAVESFRDFYFILRAVYEGAELIDFHVEMANQAACAALGLAFEDIAGESLEHAWPFPDKLNKLVPKLSEALATQQPVDFDLGNSLFEEADAPPCGLQARCVPDGNRLFLSVTRVATALKADPPTPFDPAAFDRAFDAAAVATAIVSLKSGLIERANQLMARILSVEGPAYLRGCYIQDFIVDDDQRTFKGAARRVHLDPDSSQQLQLGLVASGGRRAHVKVAMTRVGPDSALLQVVDQTTESRVQAQADKSARDFELLAESMSDVVLRVDAIGTIQWSSPSAEGLLGLRAQDTDGENLLRFVHRDFARAAYAALNAAASGREAKDFLLRIIRQGSDPTWVQGSARPIRNSGGGVDGVVVSLRDVDTEQKAKQQLEDLNLRDPLTGLGTRAALVDRLTEELKDSNPRVSVVEFHLDHLGRLNDAIGFSGADQVISTIGKRLRAHVGAHGDVYRIAGGEFGLILREMETVSQAVVLAERLRTLCAEPISVNENQVSPTLSVGVAFARDADVNKILYDAHRAMRSAKRRGGGQIALADDRGGLDETRWLVDEAELKDALREGRYTAYFQPIVTLPEAVIAGFEVLVRCRQPDGRATLPPGQMAVAEATGLIREIDRLVLRQSLDLLRRLEPHQFVSVNVSVRSLADPSYLQWVEKSVHDQSVDPSRVRLEVTESTALAVPPSIRTAMERLVSNGFTWYMDDFGTGYSSLSSLRDLPMGGLKLDRSFTSLLAANRDRVRNLTQGLVRLADDMGLVTVAEGVETQEEADLLAAQGWKYGQGYLYGRAIPAEDALRLATTATRLPTTSASG